MESDSSYRVRCVSFPVSIILVLNILFYALVARKEIQMIWP